MINGMNKVAIVACSNGQEREYESQNNELVKILKSNGKDVVLSNCLYAKRGVFQGTPKERADELMRMFEDPDVSEIYDISGGDIANQLLPYIDFDSVAKSKAVFWGYSDLTTIINAIYTLTGKESVLYQVKNMVWGDDTEVQRNRFFNREELFHPRFSFCQGDSMEGVVVGGNIRCFLKLAGTKYFPELQGKILFLESLGGLQAQMAAYLAWLQQLGAFEKVNGILLGNFREMEKAGCESEIVELVKYYAGPALPIAKTAEVGHKSDSKAIVIGKQIEIKLLHCL